MAFARTFAALVGETVLGGENSEPARLTGDAVSSKRTATGKAARRGAMLVGRASRRRRELDAARPPKRRQSPPPRRKIGSTASCFALKGRGASFAGRRLPLPTYTLPLC